MTTRTVVETGWPFVEESFVVVVDPDTRTLPQAAEFINRAAAAHELPGRPTPAAAAAINELVRATRADAIVSVGAGLVIDAAKLAVFEHRQATGRTIRHVAIPCGPEPYRAVTPFTMYDAEPGARGGVQEEWLRPQSAALIRELLEQLPAETVALFAGDSAVHALESLLSKLTTEDSKLLATRAASTFMTEAGNSPDVIELAFASIAAADAFDTTKLGLAHALSRPLGIAAGVSHDGYNLMLGAPVVRFWGDAVISTTAAGEAFPRVTASQWMQLFDGYRARAALPAALAGTTLTRADIEAAIGWAPNSSGIPNLPRSLSDGDLEQLMADAWMPEPVSAP